MPQSHVSHNTTLPTLRQLVSHTGMGSWVARMCDVPEENTMTTAPEPGKKAAPDKGPDAAPTPEGAPGVLSLLPMAVLVAVVGTAVRIAVLNGIAAVNEQELWDQLTAWDSKYYLEIARVGYFDADIHTGAGL